MESYGASVAQWVAEGRVDIAVSYMPLSQVQQLIDGETLLEDEMVLVGARTLMEAHSLGTSVSFSDLAGLPFVLPTLENGQRRWLDKAARERGFAFNLMLEIDSLSAMLDAVSLGHGFTMQPALAVAADLRDRGLACAVIDHPKVPAQLTMFTARGRGATAAAQQVMQVVKREAAKLRRTQRVSALAGRAAFA
jgi:LysR family nitrogen assimilation transcriptional regulator